MAIYRIEESDKRNLLEYLNRVPLNRTGKDGVVEALAFTRIINILNNPIEEEDKDGQDS